VRTALAFGVLLEVISRSVNLLSVSAEAEPVKTLVGLGRPLDSSVPGFFDESLPESGIREVDEPDDYDDDGFTDNEADTRLEVISPSETDEPPDGPVSEDWIEAPESSPLPVVSDWTDPFREAELMPANWENDDEEATRPQLFLPNHPSEPPPSLPGSRLADSDALAPDLAALVESWPRHEAFEEAVEPEVELPARDASHAVTPPSSPLATAEPVRRHGLNPRLSGMLAGAGMGAAAAIALVALLAWRSPALAVPELPPVASLPESETAKPVSQATVASPDVALSAAEPAARSHLLGAPAPTEPPPARHYAPTERRVSRSDSGPVTALPVKLEEEAVVTGPRGMLRVSSLPSAHVVLDGRPVGMTPKLLPISAGEHTVLFVHPALGRRTVQVSVENNAKAEAYTRF